MARLNYLFIYLFFKKSLGHRPYAYCITTNAYSNFKMGIRAGFAAIYADEGICIEGDEMRGRT